jgi:hypothetical protein
MKINGRRNTYLTGRQRSVLRIQKKMKGWRGSKEAGTTKN